MSTQDKIRNHVEGLFRKAPNTRRAEELREEMIVNLQERCDDLVSQGKDPELACNIVLADIGDVEELLHSLREQVFFDPVALQRARERSGLLISLAVGLYIVSFAFPIITYNTGFSYENEAWGPVLMFVCWAIATGLLVFNAISKPKYIRMEPTVVEEFKEYTHKKDKRYAFRRALHSIVWMLMALVLVLLGAFHFLSWYWFIVLPVIGVAANQIINMVFLYMEEDQ